MVVEPSLHYRILSPNFISLLRWNMLRLARFCVPLILVGMVNGITIKTNVEFLRRYISLPTI